MTSWLLRIGMAALTACASQPAVTDTERPAEFVSLDEVDPSIVLEMRYFGSHNFIGRPVTGYAAPKCLLTRAAAERLKTIQAEVRAYGLSLKMYDCYRPQRGVNDFIRWSKDVKDQKTKSEFYPRVDKRDVFKLGFVSERSGHSRGSTVDLTLIPWPAPKQAEYRDGQKLVDCAAPRGKRFDDNTLDMGTGYDCFDERAATANASVGTEARRNRLLLKALMDKHGFENYSGEWWHFTLKGEPFPSTYFDFEVK